MNDLVVGTFGRGIYILDDYTPLRVWKPEMANQACVLFPVREAWMYIPERPLGMSGKGFQGESYFTAANPPYGATFSYLLKDGLKTKRQQRQDAEREAAKKNQVLPYPSQDELRAEAEEEAPSVLITISDTDGSVVRTLQGPASAGLHRVSWDLRDPAPSLPRPRVAESDEDLFAPEPGGPLVLPGVYRATLSQRVGGVTTPLAGPVEFTVTVLGSEGIAAADRREIGLFQQKVARLQRAVSGALDSSNALAGRLAEIKRALDHSPSSSDKDKELVRKLEKANLDILRALRGDVALRARNDNTPVSISERVMEIVGATRFSLGRPTTTQREQYAIAAEEFSDVLARLRRLIEEELKPVEKALDASGAPWTPGRLPDWRDK
jgi:hypothetical protein